VQEFWSLPIAVDRRVLVPRPETELVVETALRLAPGARRVLDVGTGSGAVAAALARELPGACVVASDHSAEALAVARANLARLAPGVTLARATLADGFRGGAFDLVVANLPYVPTGALAGLAPEVRDWEPRAALDGGPDGLDLVRVLVATAPAVLAIGGWLVLEVGVGQAEAVAAAAVRRGYGRIEVVPDAAGIDRVVAAEGRGDGWTRS
jgi:release factor glutamine methyltransferase